jgi:hypothetical protein
MTVRRMRVGRHAVDARELRPHAPFGRRELPTADMSCVLPNRISCKDQVFAHVHHLVSRLFEAAFQNDCLYP